GRIRSGSLEGCLGVRVGNARTNGLVSKLREFGKFTSTAFAYGIGQFAVVVGEEQEGLPCAPFLAHEKQGNHGGEQQQGGSSTHGFRLGQVNQAFTEGPIADLVVVLQKKHE